MQVAGRGWRTFTPGGLHAAARLPNTEAMLRPRRPTPAPTATVTFRSPRTGEELARFEHQSRRQVERLLAQPPEATVQVACTVEVRAAA
ncbi:MAG: hypothetical protein QOH43_2164 [Solirubrobacteraceae bacterium]|jgi:hypothetical protein|nr:hypothetical protein [Solirubrobacteraceae bacterium]